MIITGKDCKRFIDRFVKNINSINKYNVEPILLFQVYSDSKSFQPVFMSKPMNVNIFNYLKEIYSDNIVYTRSLKYLPYEKIKVKNNDIFYTPIIFSSFEPIPFMKITVEDLNKSEYLLPSKYNSNTSFSRSYFIVTELFKDFIKDKIIYGISDQFEIYEDENTKYDTSAFLYENDVNKNIENEFIQSTSPKNFFPLLLNEKFDKKSYIENTIKDMLVDLNSSIINYNLKDIFAFKEDIYIVSEGDIEYDKIMLNVKNEGTFEVKNDKKGFKLLTFSEFFKVKSKTIMFSKKMVKDTINNVDIIYAGICFKSKDSVIYVFYKYIDQELEIER